MTDRIRFVLEALTPISHGDTRTGIDNATNMRLFSRQPIQLNGRTVYVPHVTENSLRTVMFRIPLADHLLRTLGIDSGVPRSVINLIYAGGAMGGVKSPGDATVLGHAVARLYPSLALLGGAVDAFILPTSKMKPTAFVVAEEYAEALDALFDGAPTTPRQSAFDLIGEETRTRGTGGEAAGNQMLYSYEVLAAGTKIAVELTLDRWASTATRSAVARAVAEWQRYIGGQGRQGRGRCRIIWSDAMPEADEYDAAIATNADAMRAGLLDGTLGTGKVLCSG